MNTTQRATNAPHHTWQHAIHTRRKQMMQVPNTPPVLAAQPHPSQQRPPMQDMLPRFACAQLTRKSVTGKQRYPDVGDRSSMPRTVAPSGGAPSWQCSRRVPCYTATSATCPTPATTTSRSMHHPQQQQHARHGREAHAVHHSSRPLPWRRPAGTCRNNTCMQAITPR